MSHFKVKGVAAAALSALMITGTAYGAAGGNGAPGPAGNPNHPAGQPQANAPQGPAGNGAKGRSESGASHGKSGSHGASGSHGKSGASHGKSGASHGKSEASHGKSGSHGNSGASHGKSESRGDSGSHGNSGESRGKSESHNSHGKSESQTNNGHAGKITICHATKSVKHPYVEITISVNGLNGHGPANDPRHHAGSWKDIIPAPAGGCPTTVQQPTPGTTTPGTPGTPETPGTPGPTGTAPTVPTTPTAPAATTLGATSPGAQAVLGAQAHGTTPAANGTAPAGANEVLGAQASGTAPAAAVAARPASASHGSLPFTGLQLAIVLLAAAAALLGGFALRRATIGNRS